MSNGAWVHRWWPALALACLAFAVYWPGRGGGFVFDDFPNLVQNTALHVATLSWDAWIAAVFSTESGTLQRPLAMLSFAIQHYATGLDPAPMKLANIALHAFNAVLVLGLTRRLLGLSPVQGRSPRRLEWVARFTAAAWALHPINLTAVLYVVQRMESLAHTFVFAGLWLYVAGRERQLQGRNGWPLVLGGLGGGTLLGMLAKESAVLLPLYAFCTELCVLRFRGGAPAQRTHLLAMFAAGLWLPMLAGGAWLLQRALQPGAFAFRDFTLGQRLLTEPRVVLDYLQWTLFPRLRELGLYHDDITISRGWLEPASTLPSMLLLAALGLAVLRFRSLFPLACLGIAWFLAAQTLTAGFIPLELVYEHRNYFASYGVVLALASLLLLVPAEGSAQRIGAMLAVVATMWFGATTWLRASEWRDPYRFARSEAAKHPQSPRATYALGQTLAVMSGADRNSPYLAQAMRVLEQARQLPGSGILPHSALLLLAAQAERPIDPAWWTDMQQRLRQRRPGPQEINAIASLVVCARDGRCHFPASQMDGMFAAATTTPPVPELLQSHGDYVLNVRHDPARALELWRAASKHAPAVAEYRASVIKLLIALGRYAEARREIDELRGLGRLGRHRQMASELESRLQQAAN